MEQNYQAHFFPKYGKSPIFFRGFRFGLNLLVIDCGKQKNQNRGNPDFRLEYPEAGL